MSNRDLSTLLAELDAIKNEREVAKIGHAFLAAYPALREAIEQLQRVNAAYAETVSDAGDWLAERDQLRALVAQQREAMRGFVDAFQLDWSGHKLGDLIEKARAVLAAEVPRG